MPEVGEKAKILPASTSADVIPRDEKGKWLAGVSGNPAGRPKGAKNHITQLKQSMEIALREGLSPKDVQAVVKSMLAEALNGNVGAGKLILDKVMSNARDQDDANDNTGGIRIVIENASIDALQSTTNNKVIDITKEEMTDERYESKP